MGKLIDRLVIGMSMREVRKLIPYKPYMINPETVMDQQTGKQNGSIPIRKDL